MNLTITPKDKPVAPTPCDIVVDGQVIGDLTPRLYENNGAITWHACIRLGLDIGGGSLDLIQGHGPSYGEAIGNAFESGRRNAAEQLRRTEELARRVGYQFEAAPPAAGGVS